MDELLRDFLVETSEHLEGAENQLIELEQNPTNEALLASIFRLLHTIKGTASFLGLNRLQKIAHGAETVISEVRDGVPPGEQTIAVVLSAIDRIKVILSQVEDHEGEPPGDDQDLIELLEVNLPSLSGKGAASASPAEAKGRTAKKSRQRRPAQGRPADNEVAEQKDASEAEPAADATSSVQRGDRKSASAKSDKPEAGGSAARGPESIRVNVDTIERIMQLVSELVLTRNQLLELTRQREEETLKGPMQRLSTLTTDLQDAVMRARMQPVGRLYANLPRLIRELSSELGKKIQLITEGADTELDRQLIEVMRDPLTHLIRNCADHGIETPADRIAAGKAEFGEVRISASHEAGQITIEISDDGRGLDLEKIKAKAVTQGLMTEQELFGASEAEICQLIFEPGFSTAANVTNVSGRGVGMDVVRSNIEAIGGSVRLKSKTGMGSTFSLKIPLTLAIAPALIVEVGTQRFAVPQHTVVEVVGLGGQSPHVIEQLQNALVLKIREEVVPVVDLKTVIGELDGTGPASARNDDDRLVVIMRVGVTSFGMIVDAVADVQEIVVKPMNSTLAHLKMFCGHTILGDGSVVLIIDPTGAANLLGIEKIEDKKRDRQKAAGHAERKVRYALFRAGEGALKVLPLSLVSRIEMVKAETIEIVNGRTVLRQDGSLMPLLCVGQWSPWQGSDSHPLLIVTSGGDTLGLIVEEIVDIVEERLDLDIDDNSPDVLGTAVFGERAVELIDASYYLRQAHPPKRSRPAPLDRPIAVLSSDRYVVDVLGPVIAAVGYEVATARTAAELRLLLEQYKGFSAVVVDEGWTPEGDGHLKAELERLSREVAPAAVVLASELDQIIELQALDPSVVGCVQRYDYHGLLDKLATIAAEYRASEKNGDGKAAA